MSGTPLSLSWVLSPLTGPAFQEARFSADLNQPLLFGVGQFIVRQANLLTENHNPFLEIAAFCPGNGFNVLFERGGIIRSSTPLVSTVGLF